MYQAPTVLKSDTVLTEETGFKHGSRMTLYKAERDGVPMLIVSWIDGYDPELDEGPRPLPERHVYVGEAEVEGFLDSLDALTDNGVRKFDVAFHYEPMYGEPATFRGSVEEMLNRDFYYNNEDYEPAEPEHLTMGGARHKRTSRSSRRRRVTAPRRKASRSASPKKRTRTRTHSRSTSSTSKSRRKARRRHGSRRA